MADSNTFMWLQKWVICFLIKDNLKKRVEYFLCFWTQFFTLVCKPNLKFIIVFQEFRAKEKVKANKYLSIQRVDFYLVVVGIFTQGSFVEVLSCRFFIVFVGKFHQLSFLEMRFAT